MSKRPHGSGPDKAAASVAEAKQGISWSCELELKKLYYKKHEFLGCHKRAPDRVSVGQRAQGVKHGSSG